MSLLVVTPETLKKALQKFKDCHVSKVNKSKNTVVISETTSTVNIGISSFNKNKDTLLVFQDGKYIEETEDYTISGDSSSITLTSQLSASSESSVKFKFVVISI